MWQSVSLAGHKIGYRQVVREVEVGTVRTTERLVITLQQPGDEPRQSETVQIYTESPTGEARRVEKRVQSFSANHTMTARADGDTLRVARSDGHREEQSAYAMPSNFLLREGVRLALRSQSGEVRELEYSSWNFSAQRMESFRIHASRLPAGHDYAWRLQRQAAGAAQDLPAELFANEDFFVLEERAALGGDALVLKACDKACALADFHPVTHVYRQLIRSPVRISESALRGRVRYSLSSDGALVPPQTSEQRVQRQGKYWQIDVCNDCGFEPPPDAVALTDALASTYWIAADNPVIRQRTADLLGKSPGDLSRAWPEGNVSNETAESVDGAMRILTRFVSQHMREQPDYSGYATALEAYQSRNGDCTEHALLLTSMARAAGIPARVVAGVAYSNERFMGRKFVFVPHAWVQAWDGRRWQSFDSGLGEFTAGYLVLGVSSGELADIARINEQLHRIEIVSAVQVKTRLSE